MTIFALNRRSLALMAATILGLSTLCSSAAQSTQVIEARIVRITPTLVTLDEIGDFDLDPRNAQCFDAQGVELTCSTLVGVGYVDKARITLASDTVQRIDIIELRQ